MFVCESLVQTLSGTVDVCSPLCMLEKKFVFLVVSVATTLGNFEYVCVCVCFPYGRSSGGETDGLFSGPSKCRLKIKDLFKIFMRI